MIMHQGKMWNRNLPQPNRRDVENRNDCRWTNRTVLRQDTLWSPLFVHYFWSTKIQNFSNLCFPLMCSFESVADRERMVRTNCGVIFWLYKAVKLTQMERDRTGNKKLFLWNYHLAERIWENRPSNRPHSFLAICALSNSVLNKIKSFYRINFSSFDQSVFNRLISPRFVYLTISLQSY